MLARGLQRSSSTTTAARCFLKASAPACAKEFRRPKLLSLTTAAATVRSKSSGNEFDGLKLVPNSCNAGFARAVNQGIRANSGRIHPAAQQRRPTWKPAPLPPSPRASTRPQSGPRRGPASHPDGRLQSSFAPLPSVAEELLPPPLLRLLAPSRFRRKTAQTDPLAVESVFGACLSVRAAILPRLGLLDEDFFFFYEEVEWCQRARRMGFEVLFLPAARVVHGWGVTANRFRGPARVEYQRSKLTFFRKTRSRASYRVVSLFLIVRTLVDALAGAVSCLATLFLNRRLRKKAATYWYLVLWHILLRPAHWGLPDKCPRNGNEMPEADRRSTSRRGSVTSAILGCRLRRGLAARTTSATQADRRRADAQSEARRAPAAPRQATRAQTGRQAARGWRRPAPGCPNGSSCARRAPASRSAKGPPETPARGASSASARSSRSLKRDPEASPRPARWQGRACRQERPVSR